MLEVPEIPSHTPPKSKNPPRHHRFDVLLFPTPSSSILDSSPSLLLSFPPTTHHLPSTALQPATPEKTRPVTHRQVRFTAPNIQGPVPPRPVNCGSSFLEILKFLPRVDCNVPPDTRPRPIFSNSFPRRTSYPSFNVITQTRRFLTALTIPPISTPFPSRDEACRSLLSTPS